MQHLTISPSPILSFFPMIADCGGTQASNEYLVIFTTGTLQSRGKIAISEPCTA